MDVRGMIPAGISAGIFDPRDATVSAAFARCVTNYYCAHFDPVMPETPCLPGRIAACHFIARIGRSFV